MATDRTKRIFADPPPWYGLAPLLMYRREYRRFRRAGLSDDEITQAARSMGFKGFEIIAPRLPPLDN